MRAERGMRNSRSKIPHSASRIPHFLSVELLSRGLRRNIPILSERKSEESREVRAASRDQEVPVRGSPHRDVGLAVLVVVPDDGFVSRSAEDSYERLSVGTPVYPPRTVGRPEDGAIG